MMVSASYSKKVLKTRILVVDDEPDNLDLLYRTFRREFHVLRAESGQRALELLEEYGEVAVIISDQRMPEMKGTEFLRKTVPDFPDTVRIILTGFTDVEDLVEAINAGQVYRYLTKPWDPSELKEVVQQAACTYAELKQRGAAVDLFQNQEQLVTKMADIAQSTNNLQSAFPAIAEAIQTVVQCEGSVVHSVAQSALGDQSGVWGTVSNHLVKEDPLTSEAIATQSLKYTSDGMQSLDSEIREVYEQANVRAHCVVPVLFRNEAIAVLSLQWREPQVFSVTDLSFISIAAKQTSLTLACLL